MARSQRPPEPDHDPLPVLVERFLAVGERTLRDALRSERDLRLEAGLRVVQDGQLRIVPIGADLGWPLMAIVRFESARLEGELTYGDRELFINLVVSTRPRPPEAAPFYALWEWAAACRDSGVEEPMDLGGATFVMRASRVEREVASLASGLATLTEQIKRSDAATIARMDAARTRQRAAWQAEMQRVAMMGDADRARAAFNAGDFDEVVRLLAPHGAALGPAARKRLQLARKALAG